MWHIACTLIITTTVCWWLRWQFGDRLGWRVTLLSPGLTGLVMSQLISTMAPLSTTRALTTCCKTENTFYILDIINCNVSAYVWEFLLDKCNKLSALYRYRYATIKVAETSTSEYTPINMYWTAMPDTLSLAADADVASWTFLVSLDQANSTAETHFRQGLALVDAGEADTLLAQHTSAWEDVWAMGSIEIEGDLNLYKVCATSQWRQLYDKDHL